MGCFLLTNTNPNPSERTESEGIYQSLMNAEPCRLYSLRWINVLVRSATRDLPSKRVHGIGSTVRASRPVQNHVCIAVYGQDDVVRNSTS
jgi:hypothetical protein